MEDEDELTLLLGYVQERIERRRVLAETEHTRAEDLKERLRLAERKIMDLEKNHAKSDLGDKPQ